MPVNVQTTVTAHADFSAGEGAFVAGADDALRASAGAGFQVSQELVPKDTSELFLSGKPPQRDAEGRWRWGYDAPHAAPVEFGSRPHWPPIAPLLGWARRVLGDESAAYAVQRKIANVGTHPQPFVRPGVEVMRTFIRNSGVEVFVRRHVPGLGP